MKWSKSNSSLPLFDQSPKFRLIELGSTAARKQTDELNILRSSLLEVEGMYPGIDHWYKEKVLPGLKARERVAYLAFQDDKPVASAVLKLGDHAKFCHVRIQEEFRDLKLGRMIFTQLALHARHQSGVKDIHFTLPEGLWAKKASFFSSFGFEAAIKASRQYRAGEEELFCSAPISTVWENARENLHMLEGFSTGGFSTSDKVVLSIHPKYAELIFSGKKTVEIRRRFPSRFKGKQAVVYETKPYAALRGEVTIGEIIKGHPDSIWHQFGDRAGCTHEEFKAYIGDCNEVYAFELLGLKPYLAPVGISYLNQLIHDELHPPQSFLQVRLDQASPWGKAITVAGLLHSWR
jgi:predicted transcriptional regulator